jgi:hypothetical protein
MRSVDRLAWSLNFPFVDMIARVHQCLYAGVITHGRFLVIPQRVNP